MFLKKSIEIFLLPAMKVCMDDFQVNSSFHSGLYLTTKEMWKSSFRSREVLILLTSSWFEVKLKFKVSIKFLEIRQTLKGNGIFSSMALNWSAQWKNLFDRGEWSPLLAFVGIYLVIIDEWPPLSHRLLWFWWI